MPSPGFRARAAAARTRGPRWLAVAAFVPTVVVAVGPVPAPLTFHRDIAPILEASCTSCHRSGGAAPFGLLEYDDVRVRSTRIVEVVASGHMPPWLPERGVAEYAGDRTLTDEQVALIRRWVEEGAVAGDTPARRLPPEPAAWRRGEPDIVVTLDEPLTVPAEGPLRFRNVVFSVPVAEARWVRAVELRPGNARAVRRAEIRIDGTGASRRADAEEPGPGFAGATMGAAVAPGGVLLVGAAGRGVDAGAPGVAWRLEPGTDLVVQLMLVPTGVVEQVRPSVGLFFTDDPPTGRPALLTLRNDAIELPAGTTDAAIEDAFVLPVAAEVTAIAPRAHALGRTVEGYAVRPDGTKLWLLRIRDWDPEWADAYRLATPVALPAGTTLGMRITYDNSAANDRNPHHPPRTVRFGEHAADERAELAVQVVVADDATRTELTQAYRRRTHERLVAYGTWKLERTPRDVVTMTRMATATVALGDVPGGQTLLERALTIDRDLVAAQVALGGVLAMQGRFNQAIGHYVTALELEPDDADTHNNLGVSYLNVDRPDDAVRHFRDALRIDPYFEEAAINLGAALVRVDRVREAVAHYQRTVERAPTVRLHHQFANTCLAQRRPQEAVVQYRAALEMDPAYIPSRCNLAAALTMLGQYDEAIEAYVVVLEREPQNSMIRSRLGALLLRVGRADEAEVHFRRAIEATPDLAEARFGLASVLASRGAIDEAHPHFIEAARLAPNRPAYLNSAAWLLATRDEPTAENTREAVRLAERAAELSKYQNVTMLDTLAAAYAADGRFDRAIRTVRAALGIARAAGDEATRAKLQSRLEFYRAGRPYREDG